MTASTWEFSAQFAPDKSPRDLPSGGDWDDIAGGLESFTMERGRTDVLGEHGAGSLVAVLDDAAAVLDQLDTSSVIGDGHALPFTPFRILAKKGATTVVLWTGYTESGWNPSGSAKLGKLTVPCTDWLGWAASVTMPESRFGTYITWQRPIMWIRGIASYSGLSSGSDRIYNMAQRWTGAFRDMFPNTGFAMDAHGTTGITFGSSLPAIKFGDLSTPGTDSEIRIDGADIIAASNSWTVCFWMQSTIGTTLNVQSSTWNVYTNGSGHVLCDVDTGGVVDTCTLAFDHCDGQPHLVCVNVTSVGGFRTIGIHTDLGSTFVGITNNAASGGGRVAITCSDETIVGDLAYWDTLMQTVPGPGSWPTQFSAFVEGNDILWSGDTPEDRIENLCDVALVTPPTLEVSSALTDTLARLPVPSTLAAGVRDAATSFLGDVWMTRDGNLRVVDAAFTSSTADDYDTVLALISDDPAEAGPPQVLVPSERARSGTRLDRIVNEVNVTCAGDYSSLAPTTVMRFDLDSQLRYGRRPKDVTSNAADASYVDQPAQDYLTAHKDPPTEIKSVTFDPLIDEDVADWMVQTLELEIRTNYRQATPDNGTELIDAEHRIIHETWQWSQWDHWTVSVDLAPV